MFHAQGKDLSRLQDREKWFLLLVGAIAVAIRLIQINQPFIDQWSWRQSDVASIARNFYERGFHFAWPQIDWAGRRDGYVGTEFPVLPFTAALCYEIFGVHEWIGRVQAVIFFAFALPFFFWLVRDLFDPTTAKWATLFYSVAPLNIVAGRAFMPDVPSLSLALIALYFFAQWLRTERSRELFLAAITMALALLIKLPTAVITAAFFYLAAQKFGGRLFKKRELWVFAAIALIPSLLWYGHALRIAQNFYPYHFFGAGGFVIENFSWYWKIAKQTVTSTLTPIVFVLALIGVLLPPAKKSLLFHWWFVAMIVFVFFVGWGNRHQWYQLPFVPIAAVFAGAACQFIGSKLTDRRVAAALSILLVIIFGAASFLAARPIYRPLAAAHCAAAAKIERVTPRDALIVAAAEGDPTIFYYAHRRGWHFLEDDGIYDGVPRDSAQAIADLEKLRRAGAGYIVFISSTRWWLDYYQEFAARLKATSTIVQETSDFTLYRLNSP